MTKEDRVKEIKSSIKSFTKKGYHKSELLTELLALQQDLVNIAFNEEHAENCQIKLWDVQSHLERLNEKRGNIADKELEKFIAGNQTIINMIKAEYSGNKGEDRAYTSLTTRINPENVLRNVELKVNGINTEIDLVVFSDKGVFMIEVKNTSKNVLIDEAGNYYCIGNYTRLDCNIAEKLMIKEKALREVLATAGYNNVDVKSLVVFTNSTINVKNRFKHINKCFIGELPYIEEDYSRGTIYSQDDILRMKDFVEKTKCRECYPITEIDIEQFKTDFAMLIAKLESSSDISEHDIKSNRKKSTDKRVMISLLKDIDVNNVAITVAFASLIGKIVASAIHKNKKK